MAPDCFSSQLGNLLTMMVMKERRWLRWWRRPDREELSGYWMALSQAGCAPQSASKTPLQHQNLAPNSNPNAALACVCEATREPTHILPHRQNEVSRAPVDVGSMRRGRWGRTDYGSLEQVRLNCSLHSFLTGERESNTKELGQQLEKFT